MLQIKKANSANLVFTILDNSDTPQVVQNLASASEILFMMKTNKTDTDVSAVVSRSLTSLELTRNDPSVGDITVPLSITDTDQTIAKYFTALQIEFNGVHHEVDLTVNGSSIDQIEIIQDIIRSKS